MIHGSPGSSLACSSKGSWQAARSPQPEVVPCHQEYKRSAIDCVIFLAATRNELWKTTYCTLHVAVSLLHRHFDLAHGNEILAGSIARSSRAEASTPFNAVQESELRDPQEADQDKTFMLCGPRVIPDNGQFPMKDSFGDEEQNFRPAEFARNLSRLIDLLILNGAERHGFECNRYLLYLVRVLDAATIFTFKKRPCAM